MKYFWYVENEIRLSVAGIIVILGSVIVSVGDGLVSAGCWMAEVDRNGDDEAGDDDYYD